MGNVIDLAAYCRARQAEADEVMLDDEVYTGWKLFEPELVRGLLVREHVKYRFEKPRLINMVVGSLMTGHGSPVLGAHAGIRLTIRREVMGGSSCWFFSLKRQYPMLDIINLPQEVFESGLRIMREGKTYILTISGSGYWSVDGDDMQDLVAVGAVDPDYGPEGRYKPDWELEPFRQPITDSSERFNSMETWHDYLNDLEDQDED